MKKKRLTIRDMEPIAREVFRSILRSHKLPELPIQNLIFGAGITSTEGLFELYFCAERPEDAVVITSTVIDRYTGEVLKVEVFLEKREEDESSLSEVNPSSQLGS